MRRSAAPLLVLAVLAAPAAAQVFAADVEVRLEAAEITLLPGESRLVDFEVVYDAACDQLPPTTQAARMSLTASSETVEARPAPEEATVPPGCFTERVEGNLSVFAPADATGSSAVRLEVRVSGMKCYGAVDAVDCVSPTSAVTSLTVLVNATDEAPPGSEDASATNETPTRFDAQSANDAEREPALVQVEAPRATWLQRVTPWADVIDLVFIAATVFVGVASFVGRRVLQRK